MTLERLLRFVTLPSLLVNRSALRSELLAHRNTLDGRRVGLRVPSGALNRGPPLCQPQRRSRPGILRPWSDRRHHHRTFAAALVAGDCQRLFVHVQGKRRRSEAGREMGLKRLKEYRKERDDLRGVWK